MSHPTAHEAAILARITALSGQAGDPAVDRELEALEALLEAESLALAA